MDPQVRLRGPLKNCVDPSWKVSKNAKIFQFGLNLDSPSKYVQARSPQVTTCGSTISQVKTLQVSRLSLTTGPCGSTIQTGGSSASSFQVQVFQVYKLTLHLQFVKLQVFKHQTVSYHLNSHMFLLLVSQRSVCSSFFISFARFNCL